MTTIFIAEPVGYVRPVKGGMFGYHSLQALCEALEPVQEKALNFFRVRAQGPITACNEGWYTFDAEHIHTCVKIGTQPAFKPAATPQKTK